MTKNPNRQKNSAARIKNYLSCDFFYFGSFLFLVSQLSTGARKKSLYYVFFSCSLHRSGNDITQNRLIIGNSFEYAYQFQPNKEILGSQL
jgi:hypothetical protein